MSTLTVKASSGTHRFEMSRGLALDLKANITQLQDVTERNGSTSFSRNSDEHRITSDLFARINTAMTSATHGNNGDGLSPDSVNLLRVAQYTLGGELSQSQMNEGKILPIQRVLNPVLELLIPAVASNEQIRARQSADRIGGTSETRPGVEDRIEFNPMVRVPSRELLQRSARATSAEEKGNLINAAIDALKDEMRSKRELKVAENNMQPRPVPGLPGAVTLPAPADIPPGATIPEPPRTGLPRQTRQVLEGGRLLDAVRSTARGDMLTFDSRGIGIGADGLVNGTETLRFTVPAGTTKEMKISLSDLGNGERATVDFFGDDGRLLASRTMKGRERIASLSVSGIGDVKSFEIRTGNDRSDFRLSSVEFTSRVPEAPSRPGQVKEPRGVDSARLSGLIRTIGDMSNVVSSNRTAPENQRREVLDDVTGVLGSISSAMDPRSAGGNAVVRSELEVVLDSLSRVTRSFSQLSIDEDDKNPFLDSIGRQLSLLVNV